MRNSLPAMRIVQTSVTSVAGEVGFGVEGSNATVPGDDQWHPNSSSELELPPLEPHGATTRYFDVFSRGTEECEWNASPEESWLVLAQDQGTVGPESGDTRVRISVDWDALPEDFTSKTVYINVTTPCRGFDRYGFPEARLLVPVHKRAAPPSDFEGFVEADGVVSIEAAHYQAVVSASGDYDEEEEGEGEEKVTYHTFKNYGRTGTGVGLGPAGIEKLALEDAPALEYDVYLYTNTTANVTLLLSPSQNYLGDFNPLEYGVALYAADAEPEVKRVQPVGKTNGGTMPPQWDDAVADAVWGLRSNVTTSSFEVEKEGAYKLRVWTLLPSIVVQKIIIDLGGLRPSYLGPPESFLVGRDELGVERISFRDVPDTVGGTGSALVGGDDGDDGGEDGGEDGGDEDGGHKPGHRPGHGHTGHGDGHGHGGRD